MESYMITDCNNGLIARNVDDLIAHTNELTNNLELRKILSSNAVIHAFKEYKISQMAQSWNNEFKKIMENPKVKHPSLASHYGRALEPNEVFMNALDSSVGIFEMHKNSDQSNQKQIWAAQISCLSGFANWSSPTKSSPSHFAAYFPDDEWLKTWSELTRAKN
jgi:hypothetical protein